MASLGDLISARFGVLTESRIDRSTSTVGTSAEEVLRHDPRRLAALIVNLSGNTIYLAPDRVPSATRGIRLGANGGSYAVVWDQDWDAVGLEWYAVANVAGSEVFILEHLIVAPSEGGAS